MTQALIYLMVFASLWSCNNSDTTKQETIKEVVVQKFDSSSNKKVRQVLIEELRKLQQITATNNKNKIAAIFQFPLSDTAFSIYLEDSSFNEKFKVNGNKTTHEMFLNNFKEIAENIWLEQINNLFRKINVESLQFKDTLEFEDIIKSEPCYYSYGIEISQDWVTLRMNMNSNINFKSIKKSDQEEIPENSSGICEHSLWWFFKFDGKKLHFVNISGAG